jgi:hypothetical protein
MIVSDITANGTPPVVHLKHGDTRLKADATALGLDHILGTDAQASASDAQETAGLQRDYMSARSLRDLTAQKLAGAGPSSVAWLRRWLDALGAGKVVEVPAEARMPLYLEISVSARHYQGGVQ